MLKLLKGKKGFGTIEIIILLAIMVGFAIIFKRDISALVEKLLDKITTENYAWMMYYVLF